MFFPKSGKDGRAVAFAPASKYIFAMKTLGIILIVLLVTLGLALFGLQMFLTKGLTAALNQAVFPAVKTAYGLDMSITNASVHLLKGTVDLEGFSVRNLKGYQEPRLFSFDRCSLEVEMLSLLQRDPVVIRRAEVDGAVLVVERNQERRFNMKELADALRPVESAAPAPAAAGAPSEAARAPALEKPAPAPAVTAAAPAPPVPVHIRRLAIDTTVRYADSRHSKDYDLALRLTGSDLFTSPAEDHPDSLLVLRGSLIHDRDAFATDLNAILSPLTDPQNPTFNATGSILNIDAYFLADLLAKNDMSSGPFSIKPSITCAGGQLKGSRIDLVLSDLKIHGAQIGETVLKLPLGGTLQQPILDLPGALQSLFSEQAVNIGKAIGLQELKKELGAEADTTPSDVLMGAITNRVEEAAESPALQQLIRQVVPGTQPDNGTETNKPLGEAAGEALAEQLGKSVKELENNEAVKESLKKLGTRLFGD